MTGSRDHDLAPEAAVAVTVTMTMTTMITAGRSDAARASPTTSTRAWLPSAWVKKSQTTAAEAVIIGTETREAEMKVMTVITTIADGSGVATGTGTPARTTIQIRMQTTTIEAGIRDGAEAREISDEKKKRKKMKRDMMITSGLATVATIHAAHGLYGGVQKRKERMKQLEEGEITPQEARKRRIKANTMDAVSIGLAALGIKGAYGEWKEVNEKRKETSNFQHECSERKVRRQMRARRARSHGPTTRHRWPDEIEYAPSNESWHHLHGHSDHDGYPHGATPQISY